ncbi:MAG TPA: 30S ribosomal protein S8 [Patescibacteria group bacterium]|nr:30S ribosomal protein S8 [Patescibacteria group bacterium]
MNTNFPVGDFLIRIKNTAMARGKSVSVPANKQISAIAAALKKAGYFAEVKKEKETLAIDLVFKNKRPLIMDIKLVSKPGRRVYLKADEIAKKRGPSQYIISTPKGILTMREALKQNLGGEVIAEIW